MDFESLRHQFVSERVRDALSRLESRQMLQMDRGVPTVSELRRVTKLGLSASLALDGITRRQAIEAGEAARTSALAAEIDSWPGPLQALGFEYTISMADRLLIGEPDEPERLSELHADLDRALHRHFSPVLAIASYGLALMNLRPFGRWTERLFRLIVPRMLAQHNQLLFIYVSFDQRVLETRTAFGAALTASSYGWEEASNVFGPWWTYFVTELMRVGTSLPASKQKAVRNAIGRLGQAFTIGQVIEQVPHASRQTVRLILNDLRDRGDITAESAGRDARWLKRTAVDN